MAEWKNRFLVVSEDLLDDASTHEGFQTLDDAIVWGKKQASEDGDCAFTIIEIHGTTRTPDEAVYIPLYTTLIKEKQKK